MVALETKNDGEDNEEKRQTSAPRPQLNRFLPGNKFATLEYRQQTSKAGAKRAKERELSAALAAAISPDELTNLVEQCITWALEYRSPRLLMQIIQLRLSYGLGTPVQRSISASGKLDDLLNRMDALTEEDFTVIEAEVRQR